jgi:hypothetical protein
VPATAVVEPRVEKRSHQISMAIRSKTADLVDCSVDVDALGAGAAAGRSPPPTLIELDNAGYRGSIEDFRVHR